MTLEYFLRCMGSLFAPFLPERNIYYRLTHKQNINFTYLFRHYKLFRALYYMYKKISVFTSVISGCESKNIKEYTILPRSIFRYVCLCNRRYRQKLPSSTVIFMPFLANLDIYESYEIKLFFSPKNLLIFSFYTLLFQT